MVVAVTPGVLLVAAAAGIEPENPHKAPPTPPTAAALNLDISSPPVGSARPARPRLCCGRPPEWSAPVVWRSNFGTFASRVGVEFPVGPRHRGLLCRRGGPAAPPRQGAP